MLIAALMIGWSEVLPASPAGGRLEIRDLHAEVCLCPKYGWEFPFAVEGWGAIGEAKAELRFRVYAQGQKSVDLARSATRMLLRLWEMARARIRFDHPLAYRSLVEVFLCDGGRPGGEQGIFHYADGRTTNGIYIYHLESFGDPVERAREIAHEYGHAILPSVSGFERPEEFGNGFLGEKLFLSWLADAMSRGHLVAEDAMGADLTSWVKANAHPLSDAVWLNGPDNAALSGKGRNAIDAYLGLHLYFWEAFPAALGRGMKVARGSKASDALKGLLYAVDEIGVWEVFIPDRLKGKEVWLPVARGWNTSGGSVMTRRRDWAKVKPTGSKLTVEKTG